MIRRFKMWLYQKYLPRETKEIYMKDLAGVIEANKELKQQIKELKAYIDGVQDVIRSRARIEIKNEVNK